MKKQISPLVIAGGGALLYLLYAQSTNPSGASSSTAVAPVTNALAQLLPGSTTTTAAVPITYGINSGVLGGNGSFYTVANYAVLSAANPNLLNPNYQLQPAEATQYLENYLDLQQWYYSPAIAAQFKTVQAGMQYHWHNYGCAEQRIFLPMQPVSAGPYIPAPPVPKSSGSGILSTVLKVTTIVAGGILTVASAGTAAPLIAAGTSAALTAESAIHGTDALNNEELQLLFQGAAVVYEILPLYQKNDPQLVAAIKLQLDTLLKQYA